MKSSQVTGVASVRQQQPATAQKQRRAELGVYQCLISSASRTRRNMLSKAAADAGWDSILCNSPEEVGNNLEQTVLQFALVDLDHRGATPQGARDLVQNLIQGDPHLLIGVCGHEADPEEEIWARQLGVWIYLPGATTSSEMSMLFGQALQIVAAQQVTQEISVT